MAAETTGGVRYTVAARSITVGIDTPQGYLPPKGRGVLVDEVKITDWMDDVVLAGRTVVLCGRHLRLDGDVGKTSATCLFFDGGVSPQLADMPGWLAEVVDAAVRTVAERSAGDR